MESTEELAPARPGFLSTELANSITHAIGLAFSITGLVLLVVLTGRRGNAREIVACSVYGATLILLYLASTLYHGFYQTRARRALQVIDHSAIYLLIAGTYTPFALITLYRSWGWSIFGVVWGCAALGVLYKIFFTGRYPVFSVGLYLVMGWLALLIIKPLLAELSAGAIWWLLAGGLCYTAGLIFYAWKSIRHHHAIWHLFVMGGSTCHFFAVMFYVLPKG
jgi:hemolysin III